MRLIGPGAVRREGDSVYVHAYDDCERFTVKVTEWDLPRIGAHGPPPVPVG